MLGLSIVWCSAIRWDNSPNGIISCYDDVDDDKYLKNDEFLISDDNELYDVCIMSLSVPSKS